MADVYDAVDARRPVPVPGSEVTGDLWQQLETELRARLASVTVADLLAGRGLLAPFPGELTGTSPGKHTQREAVEDVGLGVDDRVQAEVAHDRHQGAAAADDHVGPGLLEARVVDAVGPGLGGERAEHVLGGRRG